MSFYPEPNELELELLQAVTGYENSLTLKEGETIRRMKYRVEKWGERGAFVTYRERAMLERIAVKLSGKLAAYRMAAGLSKPVDRKKLQALKELLRQESN